MIFPSTLQLNLRSTEPFIMKKTFVFTLFLLGIFFYARSQDVTGGVVAYYDSAKNEINYRKPDGLQVDSVTLIVYMMKSLDVLVENQKPSDVIGKLIEAERHRLDADRVRILIEPKEYRRMK